VIRLLFWIGLIVLVVMAVRSKAKGMMRQTPPPAAKPEPEAEKMASCAHCGLHFPASEAVRADGLDYCSPAHVRLPPR
jgi:uncharacterized protein